MALFTDAEVQELIRDPNVTSDHLNFLASDADVGLTPYQAMVVKEKVAELETTTPGNVVDASLEQFPMERFTVKNLAGTQEEALNYLKKIRPDKKWAITEVDGSPQIVYKGKDVDKWFPLDPSSAEFQDITDSLTDILQGVTTGIGEVGGALLAARGGLGAMGAGAIGGGSIAGGAFSLMKQLAAQKMGVSEGFSPEQTKQAMVEGAVAPLTFGSSAGTPGLITPIVKGAKKGLTTASDYLLEVGAGATDLLLKNKDKVAQLLKSPAARTAERQAIVENISGPAGAELKAAQSAARAVTESNPAMMSGSNLNELLTEGADLTKRVEYDLETIGRLSDETQGLINAWKDLHYDVFNKPTGVGLETPGLTSDLTANARKKLKFRWDELEHIRRKLDDAVKYSAANPVVGPITKAPMSEKPTRQVAKGMADKLREFLNKNPQRKEAMDTLESTIQKTEPYVKFDPEEISSLSKVRTLDKPGSQAFMDRYLSDYPDLAGKNLEDIATLNASVRLGENMSRSPYTQSAIKEIVTKSTAKPVLKNYIKMSTDPRYKWIESQLSSEPKSKKRAVMDVWKKLLIQNNMGAEE